MGGKNKSPLTKTQAKSKSPLRTGNISPIPHTNPKVVETFTSTPDKSNGLAELISVKSLNSDTKKPNKSKTFTNLYYRAKEIAENKERKVKAIFDQVCPFKPKLNGLSEKMVEVAKKEGKDLKHQKKTEIVKPETPVEDPKTPKKLVSLKPFLERNYVEPMIIAEKRKIPRYVSNLDKIDEFCTFQPVLDKKSVEIASKKKSDVYSKGVQSKKEMRIMTEKMRIQQEEEELAQCTFTPRINKNIDVSPKVMTRTKSEIRMSYRERGSYASSPFRLSLVESHELN
ncbi:hypothetical protein SteCoe_9490 [Stentor coeruleus]|uniref:Uncharacterized protein n=1 Tax=Stentor coeruleus TaxID=5963 RepID=A0A1R2CHV9_9CILI|nr:hypothetical protein SteCoe_9490 [Stentor coeruleus]